jgi:CheY-like chemotaxis protein
VREDAGMPVAVLIVDDNARFRERARERLEADGYEVVAEAADAA